MKAVAEIVNKLIDGITTGKDVDLNDIKRDATTRYKVRLRCTPPLLLTGFGHS